LFNFTSLAYLNVIWFVNFIDLTVCMLTVALNIYLNARIIDNVLCSPKLQAFRTIKCYLGKLEKVSENPDSALEAGN